MRCAYCGTDIPHLQFWMGTKDGDKFHYRCWFKKKAEEGFFDDLVLPPGEEKP